MVKKFYEFVDLTLKKEIERQLESREERQRIKVFKICSKCGERKSLLYFSTAKRNRSGRSGICKVCRNKEALKYYYNNREEILIKMKEYQSENDRSKYFENYKADHKGHLQKLASKWYQENKKKIKKRNLEYYYANEEACNKRRKLWIKNNKEKIKEYNREYNRTHKR